jgi:hypothetical protein
LHRVEREEVRDMAGICRTCKFFKGNVSKDEEQPHYCDYTKQALTDEQANSECDEHKAKPECGCGG